MTASQNRIHGRLQSVHWNKPKSRTGARDREPLSVGLRKVVTGMERHGALDRVERELLHNRMRHLCDLLEQIDRCDKGTLERGHPLREMVKESYGICTAAGTATLERDRETPRVRQGRAVFHQAHQASRQDRAPLGNVPLHDGGRQGVPQRSLRASTFAPSARIKRGPRTSLSPRAGAPVASSTPRSKSSCSPPRRPAPPSGPLASSASANRPATSATSSIRQHGRFFITKTHGRLDERWNFPDLQGFDPRARVEFRRVLAAVDGELRAALVDAEAGLRKRDYPTGSWLTLPPPRPLSPVPSTVRSLASDDRAGSDRRHVSPGTARELQEASPPTIRPLPTSPLGLVPPPAHTSGPMDQRNSSPARKSTPPPEPLCTTPAAGTDPEPALSPSSTPSRDLPAPKEFTAAAPIRTRIGRTSVTFETEGAARGGVAIARTVDGKGPMPATSIDMGALDPGEVRKFAREPGRDHVVLHLHQGHGQSTQITLRWLQRPGSDASPTS